MHPQSHPQPIFKYPAVLLLSVAGRGGIYFEDFNKKRILHELPLIAPKQKAQSNTDYSENCKEKEQEVCPSVTQLCDSLFVTPRTAARQAPLIFTVSLSLLKLMSIESMMPSNHLILCRPLLLLPSIFPSSRVFSNESVLCIRWSKYQSFNFSISPSNAFSGLISFTIEV